MTQGVRLSVRPLFSSFTHQISCVLHPLSYVFCLLHFFESGACEAMRILSWRLILALIIGVSLVSIASSWYEVQAQKEALRRDLDYKSATLGESLAGTAELCLAT